MLRRRIIASAARDRPVGLGWVVFFLPLACYWLLAVVMAVHPQPLWVLSISAPPLVLITLAVVGSHLRCEAE
jgi:hypothetical protein